MKIERGGFNPRQHEQGVSSERYFGIAKPVLLSWGPEASEYRNANVQCSITHLNVLVQ